MNTKVGAPLWVIDGWHLAGKGVGQGVYATRLIEGLIRHPADGPVDLQIMAPVWGKRSAWPSIMPEYIQPIPSPHTGHDLIDRVLWSNRLARFVRRMKPTARLFSPGPFWSFFKPSLMAVTYHDRIYHYFPRYQGRFFIRRWLWKRTEKYLRHCTWIFTQSDHSRQDLAMIPGVDPSRIAVIPAWLPPGYYPDLAEPIVSEVRSRYGLPPRFWLYVGGYDYRKNVEFLIKAFAAVARRPDCPPLVLAGSIPRNTRKPVCDVFGALKAAHLDERNICMPGFIGEADMPALYRAAELLVYPSLYEGYGLPPLEAMGCGCPAIVADNSSLPEVVKDRAYRFDTQAVASLVNLFERSILQPLPLNPSFDRREFDESRAIDAYWKILLSRN